MTDYLAPLEAMIAAVSQDDDGRWIIGGDDPEQIAQKAMEAVYAGIAFHGAVRLHTDHPEWNRDNCFHPSTLALVAYIGCRTRTEPIFDDELDALFGGEPPPGWEHLIMVDDDTAWVCLRAEGERVFAYMRDTQTRGDSVLNHALHCAERRAHIHLAASFATLRGENT